MLNQSSMLLCFFMCSQGFVARSSQSEGVRSRSEGRVFFTHFYCMEQDDVTVIRGVMWYKGAWYAPTKS